MKTYIIEENEIVKDFDHSMYEIEFAPGPNKKNTTTNILARNIQTLVKMIDKFKPFGCCSAYVVRIENKGICSDVYVGDLYKY